MLSRLDFIHRWFLGRGLNLERGRLGTLIREPAPHMLLNENKLRSEYTEDLRTEASALSQNKVLVEDKSTCENPAVD